MRGDVEASQAVLDRLRGLREASDEMRRILRRAAIDAVHAGTPKAVVARAVGVTRLTIVRWVEEDARESEGK